MSLKPLALQYSHPGKHARQASTMVRPARKRGCACIQLLD
jgi:hypothetical protein